MKPRCDQTARSSYASAPVPGPGSSPASQHMLLYCQIILDISTSTRLNIYNTFTLLNRGCGSEAMKHAPCTITSNIVFILIFPGLLLSLSLRYNRQQVQPSAPPPVCRYQPGDSLQYCSTGYVLQWPSHPAALQSQ